MSDDLDSFLDQLDNSGGESTGASGKGLRAQLEKMLDRNQKLEAQLAQVTQAQRGSALESLFAKHGIPGLAKDFFPSDTELTDEAATSFVEKYGQLWGATAAPATTPPAQQAATSTMQQFSAQAAQPPVAPRSEDEYRAQFAQANTRDELIKMMSDFEGTALMQTGD